MFEKIFKINNKNSFKLMIKFGRFKKEKKTGRYFKECRDQQKSRINQINGLESNRISSSKDHPKSFFYKKS